MFETTKLPTEDRTVSGSSVSFNTHYALPLKACKVSFSATQSGSGTPTPSNNRPYIPVNSIGLTANSTPVSVSLGADYVGSELDLVNKELSYDKTLFSFTGLETWGFSNSFFYADFPSIPTFSEGSNIVFSNGIIGYFYLTGSNQHRLRVYITGGNAQYIDANTNMNDVMKSDVNGLTVIDERTVSIANIPDLSSILGDNTFSTDTGTLEITFSDLQERTASGSVASFNTALAMPLVECKTEFMCTETGTGEKSPSNPYTLVGVDDVGVQYGGQNIWNEQCEKGNISEVDGTDSWASDRLRSIGYTPILPNHSYRTNVPYNSRLKVYYYDEQKSFLEYQNNKYNNMAFTTPINAYYMRFVIYPDYGITYNNDISINANSTDTTYHPYILNTVTLIDLDGTRYGGYIDVVNKKGYLTHGKKLLDGVNYGFNGVWGQTNNGYGVYATVSDGKRTLSNEVFCNKFELSTTGYMSMPLYSFYGTSGGATTITFILPSTITSKAEANEWLENNNVEFTYPLTNPIEIDLDIPTLSTIIGNNSFASDSGDIELKYKDCDLAKRGDFRQVFKIPD